MDTTPTASTSMGPPSTAALSGDEINEATPTAQGDQQHNVNGGTSQPVGAAAAAQQPKVVQTAFIHKLYK